MFVLLKVCSTGLPFGLALYTEYPLIYSPVHTSNNVEATLSNAIQVERFFRQCRMLLRHCCWCGRGLRIQSFTTRFISVSFAWERAKAGLSTTVERWKCRSGRLRRHRRQLCCHLDRAAAVMPPATSRDSSVERQRAPDRRSSARPPSTCAPKIVLLIKAQRLKARRTTVAADPTDRPTPSKTRRRRRRF